MGDLQGDRSHSDRGWIRHMEMGDPDMGEWIVDRSKYAVTLVRKF